MTRTHTHTHTQKKKKMTDYCLDNKYFLNFVVAAFTDKDRYCSIGISSSNKII